MRIKISLPLETFAGRADRMAPGAEVKIAPDSPLKWEDRRVGTLVSAMVDPLGQAVEVVAEVADADAVRALRADGWPYPITLPTVERLAEIIDGAPEVPGMPPGKWIVYSVGCCWWTTDVRDSVHSSRPGAPIPLCPTCGAPLMQAPAAKFIAAAISRPDHYGPAGLEAFLAAFRAPCHRAWTDYEIPEV